MLNCVESTPAGSGRSLWEAQWQPGGGHADRLASVWRWAARI